MNTDPGRDGFLCAVDVDGDLACLGSFDERTEKFIEVKAPVFEVPVISLSGKCALLDNGRISCWGRDPKMSINPPSTLGKSLAVYAGDHNACARSETGKLTCWSYFADKPWIQKIVESQSNISEIFVSTNIACFTTTAGSGECGAYWQGGPTFTINRVLSISSPHDGSIRDHYAVVTDQFININGFYRLR